MLHCETFLKSTATTGAEKGRRKDHVMSQQLAFSSIASVLAMACLCLAAGSMERGELREYDTIAASSAQTSTLAG